MKLFFWRKKPVKTAPVVEQTEIQDNELAVEFNKITEQKEESVQQPKSKDKIYSVLSIKNWCDEKLSPVAWARIMLKTFSILREYGYNFAEMQNPTSSTTVNQSVYLILRAAIIEIYQQDYKPVKSENTI